MKFELFYATITVHGTISEEHNCSYIKDKEWIFMTESEKISVGASIEQSGKGRNVAQDRLTAISNQ